VVTKKPFIFATEFKNKVKNKRMKNMNVNIATVAATATTPTTGGRPVSLCPSEILYLM
jgi:hypothetical protein